MTGAQGPGGVARKLVTWIPRAVVCTPAARRTSALHVRVRVYVLLRGTEMSYYIFILWRCKRSVRMNRQTGTDDIDTRKPLQ